MKKGLILAKNLTPIWMISKIKEYISTELESYFSWIPICLSFGILAYFSLSYEPSLYFSLGISGVLLISLFIFSHRFNIFRILVLIFCISLGFSAASYRAYYVYSDPLKEETQKVWLKGEIEHIQHIQSGKRITLKHVKVYNKNIKRLNMIRLNIKGDRNSLNIGDIIKVQAILLPPPKPVTPHGYNFARYAYFKQLNAIGYSTSKITVFREGESSWKNFFANLRNKVIERIKSILDEPFAGIANGILVGDSSSISKQDYEIVRISGIAHLLAISGMHMVIVVAILFISTRFLILRSEYLALRVNSKKAAAIVAFIGSTLYLLLTLGPVSAQRAYVMSSIILFAIIFDHNSSGIRAIAVAATIILLITPEEILSPSLQMSFIASLALISTFNILNKFLIKKNNGITIKIINYFISIILASLTAGFATAPFIIYHFNQFSFYSTLTNLLAIPINDFWVMPFGLLALILMPLGLDKIPIIFMGFGIENIFKIANKISILPYASLNIPSFSDVGIFLIGFGFIGLCISSTHLRFIFLLPILIGLSTTNPYWNPDILIESNGKLFAIRNNGELIFSTKSGGKFTREVWKQAYMQKEVVTLKQILLPNCTPDSCLYRHNNKTILIYNNGEQYCDTMIDLAINLNPDNILCHKTIPTITLQQLKKNGNLVGWIKDDGIDLLYSGIPGARKWHY